MPPKKTTKKTESDIRCFERHLICSELKLEDIECDTFDAFYDLEKRHQSKLLTHLIPEFRKIGGGKYPGDTLKGIVDSVQREIRARDQKKYSTLLLNGDIQEKDVPSEWSYQTDIILAPVKLILDETMKERSKDGTSAECEMDHDEVIIEDIQSIFKRIHLLIC